MTEPAPFASNGFLRRLRRARILVLHPDDEDRKALVGQLRRIGCQTEVAWPPPVRLDERFDVIFFLLTRTREDSAVSWMSESDEAARIAIIAYETPDVLEEIEIRNVHGVLSKPMRIFGVLAAITAALASARRETRLGRRVKSLDDTLRARRRIEQAVLILSREKCISEEDAYARIREKSMKSMKSKRTLVEIADAIIAASDI